MKDHDVNRMLREADRFSAREVERLELGPAEATLAKEILAEPETATETETVAPRWFPAKHRRRGLVGVAGLAAAAVTAALVLLLGGSPESGSRAYGAEVVRFAESTPLLLLEEPGWRVENLSQSSSREGLVGSMEFVTGPPIPDEGWKISANSTVSGLAPKEDRQRKVELSWRPGELQFPTPPGVPSVRPVEVPVLGTTALVNTRAGRLYSSSGTGKRRTIEVGGTGDRQMAAIWREEGRLLEMRAWVSNLADFEERLGWLIRVDSQTWLDAMPPAVAKAADYDATVHEILEGIPVPDTFRPSRIPDEGLTTSRGQVGAAVTGTVACLWFRQWGQARRAGDRAARLEAERAMATSKRWPILREMAADGGYPMIWRLSEYMPGGVWIRGPERTQPLLPKAEALGCARWGIPVLPWKQKRQNERAEINGRPLDLRP